jgi:predicted metal-dependent peptidase
MLEFVAPTQEEMDLCEKTYSIQALKFLQDNPFIGSVLLFLEPSFDFQEAMAGVTLSSITFRSTPSAKNYGRMTLPELSPIGQQTLLGHESFHICLDHLFVPSFYNLDIVNLAQDLEINLLLSKESHLFKLSEMPKNIVHPKMSGSVCTVFTIGNEENFIPVQGAQDMSWVEIYKVILEWGEAQAKKKRQDLDKWFSEFLDSLDFERDGMERKDPQHLTPEEQEMRIVIQQRVFQAALSSPGYVPEGLLSKLNKLREGKVPWQKELANTIRSHLAKNDFSHRRNNRYSHIAHMPTLESCEVGDVFLALDTSGSMSEDDLVSGVSEFRHMRQSTRFRLHFLCCDSATYDVYTYEAYEEPDWENLPIKGGGGTSFVPIFDIVKNMMRDQNIRPELLCIFTDTFGTFPNEGPDYKVIWCSPQRNGKVPFGKLITMEDH